MRHEPEGQRYGARAYRHIDTIQDYVRIPYRNENNLVVAVPQVLWDSVGDGAPELVHHDLDALPGDGASPGP
jgi:hypothetical protein